MRKVAGVAVVRSIAIAYGLAGCAPGESGALEIVKVNPSTYSGQGDVAEELACKRWRLTPTRMKRFFGLSREYPDSPYREFYQVNCTISGELVAEGKRWSFSIEGGGTAVWRSERATRFWGCAAQACEPLVIMLTDGMRGDN